MYQDSGLVACLAASALSKIRWQKLQWITGEN